MNIRVLINAMIDDLVIFYIIPSEKELSLATNSNFPIPIFVPPNVVDRREITQNMNYVKSNNLS